FNDPAYLERLNMPALDQSYLDQTLLPGLEALGIIVDRCTFLAGKAPHRTSWGQRLTLGAGRETLVVFGNRTEGNL
ncbi:MAG: hypothetical protein MI867_09860, partial [Pseudomonadales bacterium]|nr:hypothetical protein [Pseudomonadales bacterium]